MLAVYNPGYGHAKLLNAGPFLLFNITMYIYISIVFQLRKKINFSGKSQEFSTCNLQACPVDARCAKVKFKNRLCADGSTCGKYTFLSINDSNGDKNRIKPSMIKT